MAPSHLSTLRYIINRDELYYTLDFTQVPDPLEYDLPIFSTSGP